MTHALHTSLPVKAPALRQGDIIGIVSPSWFGGDPYVPRARHGLERAGDLMLFVERRLRAMCTTLVDRAAEGDAAYRRLIDDGH